MNKDTIIYICSCSENGGIYTFALSTNGNLKKLGFTPVDRPMYAVINDNKLHVILRSPFDDSDESGIVTFKIDQNGQLCDISEAVSTKGVVACHLCCDNDKIYAVNYLSGSVTIPGDTLIIHNGSSIHPTRQTSSHMHFITTTPDNKYILATDLGADRIYVYSKDLELLRSVNTKKGAGPRHLAFSDDGKLCFCINELENTIAVYLYNDGTLTETFSTTVLPENFNGTSTAAAIRYHDGYIYSSNRGHDSICCHKVLGDKLSFINCCSCGGRSPRDFDILNDLLISTNEDDDSVTVLKIGDNKDLSLIQKIEIKKALCVTITRG